MTKNAQFLVIYHLHIEMIEYPASYSTYNAKYDQK